MALKIQCNKKFYQILFPIYTKRYCKWYLVVAGQIMLTPANQWLAKGQIIGSQCYPGFESFTSTELCGQSYQDPLVILTLDQKKSAFSLVKIFQLLSTLFTMKFFFLVSRCSMHYQSLSIRHQFTFSNYIFTSF